MLYVVILLYTAGVTPQYNTPTYTPTYTPAWTSAYTPGRLSGWKSTKTPPAKTDVEDDFLSIYPLK